MDMEDFLQEYAPHFTRVVETGRIRCELNGHEFAPRVDVLSAFVRGKKFYKLKVQKGGSEVQQNYKEFIIPSKNFSGKMYCRLTGSLLDCDAQMALKHMRGKKFKKRKAKLDENPDSFKFTEEPNLSDIEREFLEEGSGSDLISEMEGEDSTYPDDIPMDAAETQTSGRKATRVSTSDVKGMSEFHGGDKLINDIQEIMQLSKKGGLKRKSEKLKRKGAKTRKQAPS